MTTADGTLLPGIVESFYSSVGRIDFLQSGSFFALGAGGDTTDPVVDTFSPAAASSILRSDALTFHVTDASTIVSMVVTVAQGSAPAELIYNGAAFVAPYLASSTIGDITDGYAFSVERDNGWQSASVTLRVVAVDDAGNVATTSASYTVTNPPAAPVIDTFSPSALATILRSDALTYHVTDETSLGPVVIWAAQGSDPVETVHDGTSFLAPYAAGSSRNSITGGYSYSIVRAGGWQRSALTLTTKAIDGQGNVTTTSAAFTVSNPPAAPVVDTFSPSAAASILRTDALTFHVTDETSIASIVISMAQGSDPVEVVYDGSFVAPYAAGSTRSSISNGYSFSLVRAAGWQRSAITLSVRVVDGQGNVTTTTAAFTVTNAPSSPVVGTFSPSDGSDIDKADNVTFHVTDETALLRIFVYATHSNGLVEVVHDGSAFKSPYVTSSTRTGGATDYTYDLTRTGDWPAAGLIVTAIAIDAQGNATTGTYTLTVTNPPDPPDVTAPEVSSISPTPNTPIGRNDPLFVNVGDAGGMRRVVLYIVFPVSQGGTGAAEVVYDDAFMPYYAARSSLNVSGSTYQFRIQRAGGWPSAPTLTVLPTDLAGNEG